MGVSDSDCDAVVQLALLSVSKAQEIRRFAVSLSILWLLAVYAVGFAAYCMMLALSDSLPWALETLSCFNHGCVVHFFASWAVSLFGRISIQLSTENHML